MSRDCPQISFWKSVSWVSTHETLIKAKNVKEGGKKESCWVSFYVQSWLKFGKRRTYVPFGQCSGQHSHFILCQLHSLTGKQLMNNWWYWFHRKRVTLRLQVHLLTKKRVWAHKVAVLVGSVGTQEYSTNILQHFVQIVITNYNVHTYM